MDDISDVKRWVFKSAKYFLNIHRWFNITNIQMIVSLEA